MYEVAEADSEALILVDAADREVGHLSKAKCHDGQGVLHRAFSLLIFNGAGELLLQQRSAAKRLWPLYWSNSCCSHPRRAESMETAIDRRLYEELGCAVRCSFLFKFQYQAQFDDGGAEHELCSVFMRAQSATSGSDRTRRRSGLALDRPEALEAEMSGSGAAQFTPWFKLEWERDLARPPRGAATLCNRS